MSSSGSSSSPTRSGHGSKSASERRRLAERSSAGGLSPSKPGAKRKSAGASWSVRQTRGPRASASGPSSMRSSDVEFERGVGRSGQRSEEHTSELQSHHDL